MNPPSQAPSPPIEIVVEGERAPTGSVVLTEQEARALPGTFGDPLRAIEAQPGVVPIVSGLPAFFIRGAPPSNVGFFFDGVELPLLYHAFFGPSVVHPGFIDSIEFYPGAAPAALGRFAGPVVSVKSRPLGCITSAEASLRIIDAGGLVESGPLASSHECRSSGARVAGRYSYAGLVLSLLSEAELDYWDYQAQASYPVGRHDAISIVTFGGYDLFRAPQASVKSGAELTFHRVDLRWDRDLGAGSTLRVALTGGADRAAGADTTSSVIKDESLRLRSELRHRLSAAATLNAGLDTRLDHYGLEANRRSLDFPDYTRLFPTRVDTVQGAYVAFELEPAPGIHVAPGVRADMYTSQGTTAVGVDPRVSAQFDVSRKLRLEHSLGIAHQRPNFTAQVPGAQIADLSGGLSGATQANAQLVEELNTLRTMLGSANETQLGLKQRIAELEQARRLDKQEAERERQFLVEQQDEFLAALLEEHEEALSERSEHEVTTRMGSEVADLSKKLVESETEKWRKVIEAANIKAN